MPSVKQESPNQCTVTPYLKCFVQPEAPGTSCIGLNPGLCSHQESLIHIGKVKTELQPISPGGHNYVDGRGRTPSETPTTSFKPQESTQEKRIRRGLALVYGISPCGVRRGYHERLFCSNNTGVDVGLRQ